MTRLIRLMMVIGVALWSGATFAADAGRQSPLDIGAGARSIGMGGGLSSFSQDASAVFYNPAGLSLLEYQEFSFQHSLLFEKSQYDFGAWVYPITEHHGVGIGYMRIGTGEIVRRSDYQDMGTFDYAESQLLISYGQRFTWLSTGITLKICNQAVADLSDYGIGLDVGLMARLGRRVTIGGIVRDARPAQLRLETVSEKVPQTYQAGLAVRDVGLFSDTRLTASCDLESSSGRDAMVHTGGELLFHNAYAVRGGYDRDNVTLGAGVKAGRLRVDYSLKLQDDLVDQHSFSLSFLIGPSVSDQIKRREAMLHAEPVLDPRVVYMNALKDTADSYMHQFRLDSALAYFQKLYELEPKNQEFVGTIAAIENAQRVQQEQEAKLRAAQEELNQFLVTYYDQARAFYNKKYYTAANDLLKLIFDIQPGNVEALALKEDIAAAIIADVSHYIELAKQAEERGGRIDAIEACDRILELDSTNVWARDTRERALAGMDIEKHLKVGIDLFNKGEMAEAAKRFRSVLEARPNDVVAREYMSKIDTVSAHVATLDDLQQDKNVWQFYLEGLRHMRDKEYDKAIASWQMVLQVYPKQPNTLNNIEQARLRLKTEKNDQ